MTGRRMAKAFDQYKLIPNEYDKAIVNAKGFRDQERVLRFNMLSNKNSHSTIWR